MRLSIPDPLEGTTRLVCREVFGRIDSHIGQWHDSRAIFQASQYRPSMGEEMANPQQSFQRGCFNVDGFYRFDPPVEAESTPLDELRYSLKEFAYGTCIRFNPVRGQFVFMGRPVGEKKDVLFYLVWQERVKGELIPPPKLRLVKR